MAERKIDGDMRKNGMTVRELELKACRIRKELLQMIYTAKTGHTGGALSSADILTTLYYKELRIWPEQPDRPDRDRFILSKGHSVEGLYVILADLGYFPKDELKSFSVFKSRLIGHPNNKVPGVEVNTGALGHGLPVGTGMALAAKRDRSRARVFVLMGDGEQAEGSIWEAAMAAAHYRLDNLCAIVDRNGLQISGRTEDVMPLESLSEKYAAFGWEVFRCDGNSIPALCDTFERMERQNGKPKVLIAETVKGKGVPFMENVAKWHHGVPDERQMAAAMAALDAREVELA